MTDIFQNGFDDVAGEGIKETESSNITPMKQVKESFAYWTVKDTSFKMKLNTESICRLEGQFKRNLLNVVTGDDIPPLAVMLVIAQAGMQPYDHRMKSETVRKLFDSYCNEGGSQLQFYTEVIMKLMMVSGFFTESQKAGMEKNLELMEL